MEEPRVPGSRGAQIDLPCGQSVYAGDLDMGMREYDCECGDTHAVVMDVHPLARFVPEDLVAILRETIDTEDDLDEFSTTHLLGMVIEEFPGEVASENVQDDQDIGYGMVWVTAFDSRRLHEVVVELVVELMEHAISHADDDDAMAQFEQDMLAFDVAEFVDQYREQREFSGPHDAAI